MPHCRTGFYVLALLAVVALSWAAVPTGMDMPLLKEVTKKRQKNHAISPFLLSNAMVQVWLGARGKTRDEMASVLGVRSSETKSVLDGYRSARNALSKQNTDVTTAIFNGLYIRKEISIKSSFSSFLRQYYGVGEERFSSGVEGANKINTAVARVTRGRIPQLVDRKMMDTAVFVLVGALYFKGKWKTQFDNAKPGTFLTINGERRVPLMKLHHDLLYGSFGSFDVVSLPYVDKDYSLLVLRPTARTLAAFDKLYNSLASLDVSSMYKKLRIRDVIVRMPRFKIQMSYELSETMKHLGMRRLFSNSADLSGISSDARLKIGRIIHEVFMEVNEEGTEAAAAVAVFGARTASVWIPPPPVQFTVDRPFFAILYHNREKLNLFSAMVVTL